MNCCKHKYFVIYRGDDTDFPGNQELIVELNTERDLTGCSAHFSFQGFTQDFAEIPADRKLRLVIPNSATSKFALGAADAKLWLTNGQKIRTVENRIHIVVTNRVDEAYDNDDPQAITVSISGGGGGGASIDFDEEPTEGSKNAARSGGIWSWVTNLLTGKLDKSDVIKQSDVTDSTPDGKAADAKDMKAKLADKRDKADLAVYSVTRTENTDWTWTADNAELEAALNGKKPVFDEGYWWPPNVEAFRPHDHVEERSRDATEIVCTYEPESGDPGVYAATATRPRYMDETLGPAKPNQQLAAVATDDAAKPADGSLMKYDAANDRFVKAVEGTDYLKTHQDISGKADKTDLFGSKIPLTQSSQMSIEDKIDYEVGRIYADMSYKADSATTLAGYGITDGAKLAMLLPPAFVAKTSGSYEEGEIVLYDNAAYKRNATAGDDTSWVAAHWTSATDADLAARLKCLKNNGFATDEFAIDLLGKPVANVKANTASLAASYSETETYAVGDAVTHDGKLYKCAVAITTAETWTPAHWTETTVATLWNNADTTSYGGQN